MNSTIHIKVLSENALLFLKKNISNVTKKIVENENNGWIYSYFPQPMFVEKTININDFELENNPESNDKEMDLRNSIKIYENLKDSP